MSGKGKEMEKQSINTSVAKDNQPKSPSVIAPRPSSQSKFRSSAQAPATEGDEDEDDPFSDHNALHTPPGEKSEPVW